MRTRGCVCVLTCACVACEHTYIYTSGLYIRSTGSIVLCMGVCIRSIGSIVLYMVCILYK